MLQLLSLALFSTLPLPASIAVQTPGASPSQEARAYLERALDAMQAKALVRDSIDWPTFRADVLERAAGARSTSDTWEALEFAVELLGDGHSFLATPGGSNEWVESARVSFTDPEGRWLDEGFGYVKVPGYLGIDPAEDLPFALALHGIIAELDARGPAGWVVDLRRDTGGNMWPMLAGIGPILGDGVVGAFVGPSGSRSAWFYRDGRAGVGENAFFDLGDRAHRLGEPWPAVAVLTSAETASSGEALATAFRGRPRTRSFGSGTAGVSTANDTVWLGDGALLFLCVAKDADRTGRVYGGVIEPDVVVKEDGTPGAEDRVLAAAVAWLRSLTFPPIPSGTEPGPPARGLSGEEAQADLLLLRDTLQVVHPGLGRYVPASAFERRWQELHDRAAGGTTDLEFYRDVSLLVAGLRCGHSRVEAPRWVDTYRAEHATHLPFHFRLIEGRMFVEVAEDAAQLPRGTEVLGIDGSPVAELVATLAATVPVDGWTDFIRPSRLQAAYEFQDSGFDHYLPYFAGFRDRFELEVRTIGAEASRTLTVAAVDSGRWAELQPDTGWQDLSESVSWRMEGEQTAVLEVGTFVNYRQPVDPEVVFARVFREIREAGAEHLILDLRGCGGGSDDVGWTLARFLIDRSVPFGGPRLLKNIRFGELVPHLSTWEENAFEQPEENFERRQDGWFELRGDWGGTIEPHPDRFEGRITVLVGPYNASGSTMLLAKLQEAGTVRLVGEPTGGSAEGPTAGVIFFLTLPNSGLRVNVPVIRESTGLREFRAGQGVEPDLLVRPTVEDFLAGTDPVLERALEQGVDRPPQGEDR